MSSERPQEEEKEQTRIENEIMEPPQYKVLLHNDNFTTMDFVVQLLEDVFHKSLVEATQIMLDVHKKGIGLCGVYTVEVAETKVATVHYRAQKQGFPLRCSLEQI